MSIVSNVNFAVMAGYGRNLVHSVKNIFLAEILKIKIKEIWRSVILHVCKDNKLNYFL